MTNISHREETESFKQFKQIGVKIKEVVNASARNPEHLKKIDLKTVNSLNVLNIKSDELIIKVNRLQQHFKLIKNISEKELGDPLHNERNSKLIANSHLRINRLTVKANNAAADLQLDVKEFTQSYKKLDKSKYVVPEIIRILHDFIDKFFYIFEDLTNEAEEVLSRISTFNEQINRPGEVRFHINRN